MKIRCILNELLKPSSVMFIVFYRHICSVSCLILLGCGNFKPGMWKRKRLNFCGSGSIKRSWKRKRTQKHLTFWGAGSESIFHKTWSRDVEAEAVNFLQKHFEERSWKQTRKRLTLYGVGTKASNILLLPHPGFKSHSPFINPLCYSLEIFLTKNVWKDM